MKNERRVPRAAVVRTLPAWGGTGNPWAAVFESAKSSLDGQFLRLARGDRALADDLFQEAFLRGIEVFGLAQIPSRPMAWLEKTARRVFLSLVRQKRARHPARDERSAASLEAAIVSDPDSMVSVRCSLGFLSRGERELLVRFYWRGQTHQEIARARGISVRAVEARLARARLKLERFLGGPCRSGPARIRTPS